MEMSGRREIVKEQWFDGGTMFESCNRLRRRQSKNLARESL